MVSKIFINMDYKKHYDLLIETRRNRIKDENGYYEEHHIVPRSMGGSNEKNNLIFLTAREHFIAHWLLWRIHKNKEMAFAFFSLVYMGRNQKIKSSRIYEECKLARREFIIENNKKVHKNKKISEEHKRKISVLLKDKPKSLEHKEKISKSLKNKPKSLEHKKKLSESLKNYDWSSHLIRNKKISQANSGAKNGRAKKVYMYNDKEELILTFDTMKEALEYINETIKITKTTFYRYILNKKIINNIFFSF
jgi:hypothetical protein